MSTHRSIARIIPSVLLLSLCWETASAQDWFWKNPLPQGNDIHAVCSAGNDIFYAVGGFGTIIKSTNGGSNWFLLETPTTTNFHAVSFSTPDWGVVVGDAGKFLQTSDGGASWIQRTIASGVTLLGVHFSDMFTGTVVGYPGIVLRTTDGGSNWLQQLAGGGDYLYYVQFTNTLKGTIVGSSGSIFRTSNAGKTWNRQVDSTVKYLYGVSFVDSVIGYAVGERGTILGTTNGGATWSHLQSGTVYDLRAVSFFDANNGTVVGESNVILTTSDGGTTWAPRYAGFPASFTSVVQASPTTAVVLGFSGLALKTTDGGVSWAKRSVGESVPLYDVSLSNASRGIAVGYGGTVLTTSNGGTAWTSRPSGVTANLHRVVTADADTAVAVGENGALVRTEDGGLTWTDMSFPEIPEDSYWYSGIAFSPGGNALIVGKLDRNVGQGTQQFSPLLRSTDKGKTWTRSLITVPPSPGANPVFLPVWLRSVAFVDSNMAVAVGEGGSVIRSVDGGLNWDLIPSGTPATLNDIAFSKTRTGIGTAVGDSQGTILFTRNGGLSWGRVQIPGRTLTSIEYDDSTFAAAVSDNGIIFFTYNGGANWTTVSLLGTNKVMVFRTNKDLYGVSTAGGGKFVVVGDGGIILGNQGPDIPVRVKNTETLLPASMALYPNYPNPFNPLTVISFQLSVVSDVRLSVYDVLGHEVAVLVNEMRRPGTYRVAWDASRLPSGMYLSRLYAGGNILTRKLLLIK